MEMESGITTAAGSIGYEDVLISQQDANDLIYKSPPIRGHQGWLLGDGTTGYTVWNPADQIMCQIGSTDLISAEDNWTLRHASQLKMKFDLPLFDSMYMRSYEGRLSIGDGVLRVKGESDFGFFSWTAVPLREPQALVFEYEDQCVEEVERTICLERFGTRLLDNWYAAVEPGTGVGIKDTKCTVLPDGLSIRYTGEGIDVATTIKVESSVEWFGKELSSQKAILKLAPAKNVKLKIIAVPCIGSAAADTVGVGSDQVEVVTAARLLAVDSRSTEEWHLEGRQQNRSNWAPSFVHLPEDPYYAQLWYLARYHLHISSGGHYPAFFINGPWGFERDVRAWASSWFHWNMHPVVLPLITSGDYSFMKPYVDWRMRQFNFAQTYAAEQYGQPGAAFVDYASPLGEQRSSYRTTHYGLSVGPMLCIQLYRLWKHSGDTVLLRDILYPVFREVIAFWKGYLEEDTEGYLHVSRSTPYEFHGGYQFRDCLTDHVHLRQILPLFNELVQENGAEAPEDDDLAAWCSKAVGKLYPMQSRPVPAWPTTLQEDGRRVYDNPFFYGETYQEQDKVAAIGWSLRDEKWVSHIDTHADNTSGFGAFCSSQTAQSYPCAIVTSDHSPEWSDTTEATQEERELWEMTRNALRTIRRYPAGQMMNEPGKWQVAEEKIAWTGHSLELPSFARLGLTDSLERAMAFYVDRYQMFPQGMWNYHPKKRWFMSSSFPRKHGTSEQLHLEHDPWALHFGLEPQGIFSETVNEMLLGSWGGLLRPFQAYAKDGYFRLPAWGGFWVMAEQKNGKLLYVNILSERGGVCRVRVPWKQAWITQDGQEPCVFNVEKGICVFESEKGVTYHLTDVIAPVTSVDLENKLEKIPEASPKSWQSASLGTFLRM
ncbi:hypothetical protein [Paenibacillus sp. GCM10028914]|uniref:glycosyl hydrolase family 95 catalytic domain-containing protein n=1 Tax=Paenibacillus sp. GCM10028914 TaxID=3273416 RepID=UPI00361A070C